MTAGNSHDSGAAVGGPPGPQVLQPNTVEAPADLLSPRLWALVVPTGVAAGLAGVALIELLRLVQHLAYPGAGTFLDTVRNASALHRVGSLLLAGVVAGLGWWLLRRITRPASTERAIWSGDADVPLPRSLGTAVLSEVVVGLGASLGREAAPRQMAAAAASWLGRRGGLTPAQRTLLVACGTGAGLAAVYDVPLGGALLAVEVFYGSIALPVTLPALATAGIATTVSWVALPRTAVYPLPALHLTVSQTVWAVLAGPVIGLAAAAFVRLVGRASRSQPVGRLLLVAPPAAFGVVGVIGIGHPQVLGNGSDLAALAFAGQGSVGLLLALVLLKPLATALCLGSGASGGLFTPALSTGAGLGAVLGHLWAQAWPGGAPVAGYAVIGAAAMIGATSSAPLSGLVLTLELTRGTDALMVPMLLATVGATLLARHLAHGTLYSVRVPQAPAPAPHPGTRLRSLPAGTELP